MYHCKRHNINNMEISCCNFWPLNTMSFNAEPDASNTTQSLMESFTDLTTSWCWMMYFPGDVARCIWPSCMYASINARYSAYSSSLPCNLRSKFRKRDKATWPTQNTWVWHKRKRYYVTTWLIPLGCLNKPIFALLLFSEWNWLYYWLFNCPELMEQFIQRRLCTYRQTVWWAFSTIMGNRTYGYPP